MQFETHNHASDFAVKLFFKKTQFVNSAFILICLQRFEIY